MADHSKPLLTSTYTNFLAELDGRLDDLALGLNPSHVTATNVPTNSVRWNGSSSKWEKYNGTTWADLAATYAISISGNAATATNGVVTTGSYANPAWITSLAGSKISGDIAGNAGTATRLATARAINGVNFDGSAAISVNTNNAVTFNNGGSGAASGTTFDGSSARTISYNTVGAPSTTGAGASGTWGISISGNAATATTAAACSGNAATATTAAACSGNAATATYATTAGNGGVTSVNGATGAVVLDTLGVSQTWVNVTSSRALGTTYTNTTGRPILVMVSMRGQGGSAAYAYVNSVEVGRVNSPDCCGVPQYPTVPFSFIVPAGATYLCTGSGLSNWAELR